MADVISTVEDLAGKFAGFLGHYGGELRVISSVLETAIGALPIDTQDKARITDALAALQTNADRIALAAKELSGAPIDVVVNRTDVDAAVSDYMDAHTPGTSMPHGAADLGNVNAGA